MDHKTIELKQNYNEEYLANFVITLRNEETAAMGFAVFQNEQKLVIHQNRKLCGCVTATRRVKDCENLSAVSLHKFPKDGDAAKIALLLMNE